MIEQIVPFQLGINRAHILEMEIQRTPEGRALLEWVRTVRSRWWYKLFSFLDLKLKRGK